MKNLSETTKTKNRKQKTKKQKIIKLDDVEIYLYIKERWKVNNEYMHKTYVMYDCVLQNGGQMNDDECFKNPICPFSMGSFVTFSLSFFFLA